MNLVEKSVGGLNLIPDFLGKIMSNIEFIIIAFAVGILFGFGFGMYCTCCVCSAENCCCICRAFRKCKD